MSKIVQATSLGQFTGLIKTSHIVVSDFWASWCGPCKAIAPLYEQLSEQLSIPGQITFAKVNTDEQREIMERFSVNAMPTFIIFKDGKETDRIVGADTKKLSAAVQRLAKEAETLGSAGGSSSTYKNWTAHALPRGYEDITEEIDLKNLDLLNADGDKGNVRVLFDNARPKALEVAGKGKGKADSTKADWVESDTDEQLMLYMPFQSTLKVHTILISSLPSSTESDEEVPMRPKTIQLYTNTAHNLGFEEADGLTPVQTITLTEDDWHKETGTAKLELKFVRFQKCSSVVLFVVDGDGDGDKVRIDRIRLIGETGEKKNPGQLQKVGEDDH